MSSCPGKQVPKYSLFYLCSVAPIKKILNFGSYLKLSSVLYGRTASSFLSTYTLNIKSVLSMCSWVSAACSWRFLQSHRAAPSFRPGADLCFSPRTDLYPHMDWAGFWLTPIRYLGTFALNQVGTDLDSGIDLTEKLFVIPIVITETRIKGFRL